MERSILDRGSKAFKLFSHVVLILLSLAAILPFWLLVVSSFADDSILRIEGYSFFPSKLTTYAYDYLFRTNGANVIRAYGITFFITIVGTLLHLLIAPMMGYVLSRRDYRRRNAMSFYVFFTMLFNGGIVASYMMWTQVFGVKNTIIALILPNLLINGFMIMLYRSNFQSNIHPALIEAAKVDGAGELRIYFKLILPLSLPILATVGLMAALGYWNDWTNGLYYINQPQLYSLQVLLNSILINIKALQSLGSVTTTVMEFPSTSIRMAMAVVGVVPIIALYPFFQRYFIRGISLGGVKE